MKVCAKYPTEELSLVINLMSFEGLDANKTGLYPSLVFSPVLYQLSPSSIVYQRPLCVAANKTFCVIELNVEEKKTKVNEILARVQLEGVNSKFPAELSGGMKKRVGLARALVMQPKYLFCDEPNSGLDPQTSMVIDKLIHELTVEFNITTIVVTHDMNSVMEIGNYIIYLNQGKKEWEGSNKDIIFSQNELLNNFIFASEFLQDAKSMRMMEQKK